MLNLSLNTPCLSWIQRYFFDNEKKQTLRSPIFSPDSSEKRYPFQGISFHVFTPENKDQFNHLMLDQQDPARIILSDIIRDIITLYSHNHKECVAYLMRLVALTDKSLLYQTIMEVLIQELLRLPSSTEKSIYYAIIVVGMCKGDPTFPSSLAKAMLILFYRMDLEGGMDVECARRLGEWFAIHLSNFKYKWKWTEWLLFV